MTLLIELGLILLFSILGGVLAVRFKQPSVLGLILVGALVGPNAFGFVTDQSLLNDSIEIGAVLLLFTLGIEFSLQKILNLGLRAIIIASLKIGVVFLASYYTSYLLGFEPIVSVFIAVILSITSTVIVIKILEQKGMSDSTELPLLVTILIIEDIFAIFALTFFSGLNTKAQLAPSKLFTGLLISLAILIVAYLIIHRLFKPIVNWLTKYSTDETVTFLSLGLCGIMSYIALYLGLSPSVGAFLAGNIVASLPDSKTFEKAIHPFLLTFTSLFFFSIGTSVNFVSILSSFKIILVLFIVGVVAKFISVGFGTYTFANFNGKQAVWSGLVMVSVGEFSLLIAKESVPLGISLDLVSITACIIFLSSIAMNILLSYQSNIYGALGKTIPKRVKVDMELFSNFLDGISWNMFKDKMAAREIKLEWKTVIRNLSILLFAVLIVIFFYSDVFYMVLSLVNNEKIVVVIMMLIALSFFFPVFKVLKNLRLLVRSWLGMFVKLNPDDINKDKKILTSFILVGILFTIILLLPISTLFVRNGLTHILVFALLLVIMAYVYRSFNLVESLMKKKKAAKIKSKKS